MFKKFALLIFAAVPAHAAPRAITVSMGGRDIRVTAPEAPFMQSAYQNNNNQPTEYAAMQIWNGARFAAYSAAVAPIQSSFQNNNNQPSSYAGLMIFNTSTNSWQPWTGPSGGGVSPSTSTSPQVAGYNNGATGNTTVSPLTPQQVQQASIVAPYHYSAFPSSGMVVGQIIYQDDWTSPTNSTPTPACTVGSGTTRSDGKLRMCIVTSVVGGVPTYGAVTDYILDGTITSPVNVAIASPGVIAMNISSPGYFGSANGNYLGLFSMNNCNPDDEFYRVQYQHGTEALTGCVSGPTSGATTHQITGVAGYAIANQAGVPDAVAGYFQARVTVPGGVGFPANFVVQDTGLGVKGTVTGSVGDTTITLSNVVQNYDAKGILTSLVPASGWAVKANATGTIATQLGTINGTVTGSAASGYTFNLSAPLPIALSNTPVFLTYKAGKQQYDVEMDWQAFDDPQAYTGGHGIYMKFYNNNSANNGCTAAFVCNYPPSAFTLATSGGATWNRGFYVQSGAVGTGSSIYIEPKGFATSTANYGSPTILTAQNSGWNGSAYFVNQWGLDTRIPNGTNPAYDQLYFQIIGSTNNVPLHRVTFTSYQNMVLSFIHSDSTFDDFVVPSTRTGANNTHTVMNYTGLMTGYNNNATITPNCIPYPMSANGDLACTTVNASSTTQYLSQTSSGTPTWTTPPSPISGMTATQVPIAASPTTIASSIPLNGTGAGIVSGPTSAVSGNCSSFTATGGIVDSGTPCGATSVQSTIYMTLTSPSANVSTGTTAYTPPIGTFSSNTTEASKTIAFPRSGTITKLYACFSSALGASGTFVLQFRTGTYPATSMTNTSLLLTVPASSAAGCYSATGSFTYTSGQALDIALTNNTGAATTPFVVYSEMQNPT